MSRRHGKAPAQYLTQEDEPATRPASDEADTADFYGDEDFEEDELDMEGFEISEQ